MSEIATPPKTPELSSKNGPRELGSTLLNNGPTQVGGMVTSVILVGQAFAHFNQAVALYAALLFSCLLAVYQVKLVQQATVRECLILVPIAALILFALALGNNNSIAPTPQDTLLNKRLQVVKEQLELRTKELENTRQLTNELRRNLGLPPNRYSQEDTSQSNGDLSGPRQAQNISGLLGFLLRQAHAQPSDLEPEETERQRALREALRAYEVRQQELQQEQKRLQEQEEQLRKEQENVQEPAQLWRKW